MTVIAGICALIIASLFTGAAIYINVAEHPARMLLDPKDSLRQWAPSYARGYAMQSMLAIAGTIAGAVAWWMTREPLWLAGAILMLANWPWTLVVIMPVNRRLKQMAAAGDGNARELLNRWAMLHAIRSALGAAAVLAFAAALA